MTVNTISKIFALLFCSIVFASAIHAQDKPQALEFDEFDDTNINQFYSDSDDLSFTQRVKRFKNQLRKERGVAAYVIYYKARISDEATERNLTNHIDKIQFGERYGTMFEVKVVTVDGGYRDNNAVEFWILPNNAEPPTPTPTIAKSETYICPKVGVSGYYLPTEPDTLRFSVSTYDLRKTPQYTLKWKVFGGDIIGGTESDAIKVKLNNNGKRATAYAEIEGLPFPCPKVFSATEEVKNSLLLVDNFGREPNGQIKARLDNFFTQIQNKPTLKSYIINYGSRLEGHKTLARRVALINTQFKFRGMDMSKVTFINGGYREIEATEIWLSFDDTQKPVPAPTVDAKFLGVPAAPKKSVRQRTK